MQRRGKKLSIVRDSKSMWAGRLSDVCTKLQQVRFIIVLERAPVLTPSQLAIPVNPIVLYIYIYMLPPPSVIYLFRGFPRHAGEHVPKIRGGMFSF